MPYGGGLKGNVDPQAEKEPVAPPPAAPPTAPVNNPKPPLYGGFEKLLDALMVRQMMGVTPQNEQMHPMYSIQQPPPGLPTVGYGGPVQLPTPPSAGMPLPQQR